MLFFMSGFGQLVFACSAVASLTRKYLSFPEQQIVIRVLAQPLAAQYLQQCAYCSAQRR